MRRRKKRRDGEEEDVEEKAGKGRQQNGIRGMRRRRG